MILLTVLTGWAMASGRARIDQRMKLPLIAVLILCLLLPVAVFGAWGLHVRFAAMGAALFFAATELRISRSAGFRVLAVILCVSVVDAASLVWFWAKPAAQTRELRSALRQLSPGTKLLAAMDEASIAQGRRIPSRGSMAQAIDRQIFDPMVLAEKRQHIIGVRPEFQRLVKLATSDQSDPLHLLDLAPLVGRDGAAPTCLRIFPILSAGPAILTTFCF